MLVFPTGTSRANSRCAGSGRQRRQGRGGSGRKGRRPREAGEGRESGGDPGGDGRSGGSRGWGSRPPPRPRDLSKLTGVGGASAEARCSRGARASPYFGLGAGRPVRATGTREDRAQGLERQRRPAPASGSALLSGRRRQVPPARWASGAGESRAAPTSAGRGLGARRSPRAEEADSGPEAAVATRVRSALAPGCAKAGPGGTGAGSCAWPPPETRPGLGGWEASR